MTHERNIAELDRLFTVILQEAQARPEFARRLRDALAGVASGRDDDFEDGPLPTPAPAFDPNAFSLIATLHHYGEAALATKLEEYEDRGQLLAIAEAQHLGLVEGERTAALKGLRRSMIEATARRIVNRASAAS